MEENLHREEKVNILLVDDRPDNILTLEAVLKNLGQNLVSALSGEEALKYLPDKDFAVILLDVTMRGMNGFEVAKLIRKREKSKHTPIIFLTAFGTSESDMVSGYSVGAVDYILKPFVPEILNSKVAVFIDLFKMKKQLEKQVEDAEKSRAVALEEIRNRKKIEQELMKHREQLEEMVKERTKELTQTMTSLSRSNAELEQFAYVASHDLQEPLRKISSFTDLLSKKYKDRLDEKADKYIYYIVDGAKRMQTLINDLLMFSRAGKGDMLFIDTDMNILLEGIISDLQHAIRENNGEITSDKLPTVKINPVQLRQLLQNLIGNALKFHGSRLPHIHISSEQKDNEVVISVRDNGIGIEHQYLERIFGIFQRLHTREEYPGSGIGLAICKKIVDYHGGTIRVESEPGVGSTFYFTIPLDKQ